jgi:hypothetical protein
MSEARVYAAEDAYEEAANAAISYMAEDELKDDDEEQLEEVAVLDDASAEMMLQRIRYANEQYEKMEAWYAFQLEKAKTVRDRTIAWAEGNLRHYFDMVPTKNTKTMRKYELPGGTISMKKQDPKYETNDELLVPWLKANGKSDLVKTKETANWDALKKQLQLGPDGTMVTSDGEIVPGVKATPRDDKFTVKVK